MAVLRRVARRNFIKTRNIPVNASYPRPVLTS
jgi:hypothetical protein